jgi:Tfp pilus assembly protein PilF
MNRIILCVSLVLLSPGFALPQLSTTPTTQEVLSATLSDMRGRAEAIDTSREYEWSDRSMLWFSLAGNPALGSPIVSATLPSRQEHSSAASVSAKRLRHRPPKAAREAYEKAAKLARNKDDQKAATELERAIAIDTDFAEAHDDLGVLYACLGRYPQAAVEFRRAMELVPEESLPYSNLAWVLLAIGQRDEAETNVRRAIQLSPDNASAHLLVGRLLIETPASVKEGLWHLEYAALTIPEAKRMVDKLNGK